MKKTIFLLILQVLLCPFHSIYAQIFDPGNYFSPNALSLDQSQNLFTNPATPQERAADYFTAGASSIFQLQEIQQFHCGYFRSKQRQRQRQGIALLYLNSEYISRYTIQGQFARQLFADLQIGIRVKWTHTNFGLYGQGNFINADIGLHYKLHQKWQFGAYIRQIRPVQIGIFEQSGTAVHIGIAYTPSPKVKLLTEIHQKAVSGAGICIALEYAPQHNVMLRTAVQSNPSLVGFGIGYRLSKKLTLESFGSFHPVLGLNTGINMKILNERGQTR